MNDVEFMRDILPELVDIIENPENSTSDWKRCIIQSVKDKGYDVVRNKGIWKKFIEMNKTA